MERNRYRISLAVLISLLFFLSLPAHAADPAALDWYTKGNELSGLGRHSEALEAFSHALLIDGEYAPAWYGKGVALNHLGRYRDANDAYDQALLRDVSFVPAWNGKGVALQNLGRSDESLRAYNYALGLDPDNSIVLENRKSLLAYIAAHPTKTPAPVARYVRVTVTARAPAATTTLPTKADATPGAKPASQKEMIYAKGETPPAKSSAPGSGVTSLDAGAAIDLVSSPEDVSSADVGAALDIMSSRGVIAEPTDNSTKNFLAAMDRVSELNESATDNDLGGAGAKKPPDLLTLLMKFAGIGAGLKAAAWA
jgi:tetratricopeptide (TPR) repeat protein